MRRIRGNAEVHAIGTWIDRGDGTQERVIDAYRVEHRDGSVEFALTPREALEKISALDQRARRKLERKKPDAECIWITTISWCECGPGFEPPTFEVKT